MKSTRLGWTLFPGRILWLKHTEINLGFSHIVVLRYCDGLLFWWWGCLWYAQTTAQGHFGWIIPHLLAVFCVWRSVVVIDLQRRVLVETKSYTQTLAYALILPRMKTESLWLVETMWCHLKPLLQTWEHFLNCSAFVSVSQIASNCWLHHATRWYTTPFYTVHYATHNGPQCEICICSTL